MDFLRDISFFSLISLSLSVKLKAKRNRFNTKPIKTKCLGSNPIIFIKPILLKSHGNKGMKRAVNAINKNFACLFFLIIQQMIVGI